MFKPTSHTQLIVAHVVVLKDRSKGFEPENRQEIRQFAYQTQSEIGQIVTDENRDYLDPVMPLRFWDDSQTFYQNQHNNQAELRLLLTDSNIPKRFLRQDFSSMTPLQLARFYAAQGIDPLQPLRGDCNANDPDKKYFSMVGPDFVDYKRRRELEIEDPYLYIGYSNKTVIGCEHYARDAFPVCPICKKIYPCRFCHNEEEDHQIPREEVSEMQCQLCGAIGPIGVVCQHCKATVSVICCDICHTLCLIGPEVKPAYHCDKCGVCRVGIAEQSIHCDKCGICVDKQTFSEHVCLEPSTCLVCQQSLADTIVAEFSLKCNSRHRIHAACYDEMLKNGQFTCPLDHKVIIDGMQYAMLRAKVLYYYSQHRIFQSELERWQACRKVRCYDCDTYSIDFAIDEMPQICHGCFGVNCRECCQQVLDIELIVPDVDELIEADIIQHLDQLRIAISHEEQDKQGNAEQYLRYFRALNKQLVPRIVYRSGPSTNPFEQLMQILRRDPQE